MNKILRSALKYSTQLTSGLNLLSSLVVLGIRIYLANIFLWSGVVKLMDWEATIALFHVEYKIIGMSPDFAAYLGTALEIILPTLLVFGIGSRVMAILLFIFNIFNVIFYPALLTPEFAAALKDHVIWGLLIGIIILYGPGKLSLDYLIQKKYYKAYKY